ncbi:low-density lipoprotein receptor-related protein 6-like [Branchiostoma lanceolatum]|uniref:low-density lipoprotein receptor-related protein 6-like n=1 Tax=Branchiostoma lanceolatum TaxID=7740 RepID=UPI003456A332
MIFNSEVDGNSSFINNVQEGITATDWSDDSINFLYGGDVDSPRALTFYGDGAVYGVEYFDQSRQPQGQTECQVDNGGCDHTCVGDPDGHRCLCLSEFHLAENNHTCTANEHVFSKALLVANSQGVLQLPHNFLELPEAGDWAESYISRHGTAFAMDFDYAGKMIFFTQEEEDGTEHIRRISIIGERSSTLIFQNGQGIEGIAVDWVASNLYWTERGLGRIHVSKLDGSLRKVLISGLDQPSGIAVHPGRSYLFWTEVGDDPKILRASPDGSNKVPLVSSQTEDLIGKPTALAIDYLRNRLYWVTSDPGNVQSCNLNGGDVQTLWSSTTANLFGVAIYKDYVLWTEKASQNLTFGRPFYERISNRQTISLATADDSNWAAVYNIKVYDDTEQPLYTSACDQRNGLCAELCIPNGDSRVCACAEGRYIQSDRVSCSDVQPTSLPTTPSPPVPTGGYSPGDFVLVADSLTGSITEVDLTSGSNATLPLRSTFPLALDYDVQTGYVYWSDFIDEKIYRGKRDGSDFDTIVDKSDIGVYGIYGLALDYSGQNIYWTDWGTEIIAVAGMDGSNARAIFTQEIDYPGGIVLDPKEGYMYWTDSAYWKPRIERAAMDGSERTILISSGLDTPIGIAIDFNERRLYWSDSSASNVQSSDMYGNNRRTLVFRSSTSFFDLSLHINDLFWTSRSEFIGINAKSQEGQVSNRVLADGFESARGIAVYGAGLQADVSNACSESKGGCQDLCLARPGGRTCVCRAYFVLQNDNTTCAPSEIKAPSYLWINLLEGGLTLVRMFEGNSSSIRNLAQQTVQVTNLLAAKSPSIIVSIDYDIRLGLVFWIDVGLKEIQQVDVKTGKVTTLINEISTGAEVLATDWVNKNLYYTDYNYNRVVVVSYSTDNSNGNSHIITETGLDKPRGIAVDPTVGYVFWSDWGQSPKIERSTLSGEDRTTIVEIGLGRPSGLVIDYVKKRLYFADTEHDIIDSCDFDGGNRQRFYSLSGTHFYDITFDGEEIMATDWSDNTINIIHSSRDIRAYRAASVRRVLGVEFYDESRQPSAQSDCKLNNGGCQQTCVGDRSGHKCLCLPDYNLAENMKSCVRNDHLFTKALLVSTDEGILQLPHNLVDLPETADSEPAVLVRGGKTVAMDFNYNEKAVYYVQEVNGQMNSIQKLELTSSQSSTIYSEGQGIAGIAVDWVTSNVYWTDGGTGGMISVARLDGSSRKILMSYRNDPRGIAVHPVQKLLYWTEVGGGTPRISRSTLAGTEQEVIISPDLGTSISKPTALSIDFLNSRLYWADSDAGTVMSSDLRGKDPQQHWTSNGGELFGVAVYKEFNFWTDRTNQTVSIGLRSTLEKTIQLQTIPHSVRVFDGSEQPPSRGPCDLQNGGCNELCLPTTADRKVCACAEGNLLQSDGLTCINPADVQTTTAAVTTKAATTETTTKVIRATSCTTDTLPPVTNGEFGACPVTAFVKMCYVICRPNYQPTARTISCLPSGNWNKSAEYACATTATPEAVSVNVSFTFPAVPCTNDVTTLNSARTSLINNFRQRGICQTASQSNVDLCNSPDQMTLSCSDTSARKRRSPSDHLLAALSKESHNRKTRLSKSQLENRAKKSIMPYEEEYRMKRDLGLNEKYIASSLTVSSNDDVVMHLVKKADAEVMVNRVKRAGNGLDVNIEVKATPDTSDGSVEDSISKTQAKVQGVVKEIRNKVTSGDVAIAVDGQTYTADSDSFEAMAVKYDCPRGTVEIEGGCGSVPKTGGSNKAAVAVGVIVTLLLCGAIALGGYMYYRRQQRKLPGQNVRLKDLETQENPVYGMNEALPYNTGGLEGADGGFLDLTKAQPENVVEIEALPEKLALSAADLRGFDDGKLSKEAAAHVVQAAPAPSAPFVVNGITDLTEEGKKVPVPSWETFDDGRPASEAPPEYEASVPGHSSAHDDMAKPADGSNNDWGMFDDDKLAKEAPAQQEFKAQAPDDYTDPGGISNPLYASKGKGNA